MAEKLPPITAAQIAKLRADGSVVKVYPRLGTVRVHGWKMYRLVAQ